MRRPDVRALGAAPMKGAILVKRKRWLLLVLLLLAGIGPIFVAQFGHFVSVQNIPLVPHATRNVAPDVEFTDENGRRLSLSSFRGRVVLLNVWATWCPPCREEMPSLDRLQAKLGSPTFEVVAISIDSGGAIVVDSFFRTYRLRSLRRYMGENDTTLRRLGIVGVPATLLIDRQGREVWRHAGATVWDQEEMVRFLRETIDTFE